MASADKVYVDPNALLKLYLHEPESRRMALWRTKIGGALWLTHQGRVEIGNGIALAAYRQIIDEQAYRAALAAFDDDCGEGRYVQADMSWRAALNQAATLSRQHSRSLGTRTLDVLHVACALELGLRSFVTYDARQHALARVAGLRVIAP